VRPHVEHITERIPSRLAGTENMAEYSALCWTRASRAPSTTFTYYGLIAEEMAAVYPELVTRTGNRRAADGRYQTPSGSAR